jgi:hypothetical protein
MGKGKRNMKKINTLLLTGVLAPAIAFANDPQPPSEAEIESLVVAAATQYAAAIACGEDMVEIIDVLTLNPWVEYYDSYDAEYVVIWRGDIGCLGGSGTMGIHITSVKIGAASSFYADARNSSPVTKFEFSSRSFDGVVANTSDVIVMEGREYGPDDANCCPSMRVRYTLKREEAGGWAAHQKQEI